MVKTPKIPQLCVAELTLELEVKGSEFASVAEGFGVPPSGGGPPQLPVLPSSSAICIHDLITPSQQFPETGAIITASVSLMKRWKLREVKYFSTQPGLPDIKATSDSLHCSLGCISERHWGPTLGASLRLHKQGSDYRASPSWLC